ncbi:hypothetical protein TSA66_17010 [Noviherbaspirillum autotrophicum]|uniref:Uncharacterized protein n=2 Tax=Noviherbaspirillum autotrophicum TaxID=709839 RepID=A0A0C1YNF0_9BURK|nr:hypothetical protein TSA66_17010 [Noviherbaspirillum autotrophicum]
MEKEDVMEQQTRHPLRDKHEHTQSPRQETPQDITQDTTAVDGTLRTHPIDGSQYLDVVEEQEYADRRPSAEEQKPRFSYLHNEEPEEPDEDAPPG